MTLTRNKKRVLLIKDASIEFILSRKMPLGFQREADGYSGRKILWFVGFADDGHCLGAAKDFDIERWHRFPPAGFINVWLDLFQTVWNSRLDGFPNLIKLLVPHDIVRPNLMNYD